MMAEDRLRELLRDPRWSLPAWPDAQVRVRRAARRQRLGVARLAAAMTAVLTTAAVVPILLLTRGPGTAFDSTANTWPAAGPFALPQVGAAGFTSAIYPAPVQARVVTNWLSLCPSPAGLQAPARSGAMAAASQTVLQQLAASAGGGTVIQQRAADATSMAALSLRQVFVGELRASDRAFWPRVTSAWGSGITELVQAAELPVLYSGPLRAYRPGNGPPSPASVVAADCGSQVALDTWVIVSGGQARPSRAAETLFLKRSGRVLLYSATSRSA
jgi:hypothetical protein